MKKIINKLAYMLDDLLGKIKHRALQHKLTKYPNIDTSVNMGADVKLIGPEKSFYIGKRSYINEAIISTGPNSKVIIGENCAIGYRVSIKAITHDVKDPCQNDEGEFHMIESDIIIGDSCWIGDNVFIREGVTLGNNVVVGANSVVTKSFLNDVVIAGVPAQIITTDKLR